ncbi:MAG: trigger factor [Chloroflexota bacterium]|nr:trigger factor [Chloroflexota bacterium]
MNAVVERLENSEVTLKVEVEPEVVAKATDKAYQRLVQRVNIPGFRRGKAPRHILERAVGMDALYREALDFVMPSAFQDAVRERQISPYADPEFEVVQLEPQKPLIFKATVAVEPTVELGDYRSIAIEPEKVEVTDEQVEQALKRLQESNGEWVPVDGREVRMGDQVSLDVVTSIAGRETASGKPQNLVAELEADVPYPRWANALAGLRVGEEKEISDAVPKDYRDANLAGQALLHRVTVKTIKEKELPAVDDELAHMAGDYDNLDALKVDVRKRLEQQAKRQAKVSYEEKVVSRLIELSRIEFPPIMVERKLDRMAREADLEFRRQGWDLAAYLRAAGRDYETLRDDWRAQATDRIKAQLVLGAVAQRESVGASEADVDAEIQRMVDNTTPDRRPQLRQASTTAAVRESIRETLSASKALNLLDELAGGKELLGDELDAETVGGPLGDGPPGEEYGKAAEAVVE